MKITATVSNDCGSWLLTDQQLETFCEELALMLNKHYNWHLMDGAEDVEISVTPGLEDTVSITGLPDTQQSIDIETSVQDKYDELGRKAFDFCQKHYWQPEKEE
jgi:hypothetical protein